MKGQTVEDKSSLGWHEFARYSGNRFDSRLFDTNLSCEIGQKCRSLYVHFALEQEKLLGLILILRSLSQGRETIYTLYREVL